MKRLATEKFDPMPGANSADKKARLARMSYAEFLTKQWKLDPGVLWVYQTRTHGLFGAGIDAVPAQDAFGLGLPGFAGMGLDPGPGPGQNYDAIRSADAEDYYFHFPDGNASVARLLVRRLVPDAIPGSTAADLVTNRADYAKLDKAGAPVRIRLSSPVMRVRHAAAPGSKVEVTYSQGGTLKSVTGRSVVLACWHSVIPGICPELPAPQKAALDFAIKVPLVYTNVFIRSWTAFRR
jgi:spermidine dehydrogenase